MMDPGPHGSIAQSQPAGGAFLRKGCENDNFTLLGSEFTQFQPAARARIAQSQPGVAALRVAGRLTETLAPDPRQINLLPVVAAELSAQRMANHKSGSDAAMPSAIASASPVRSGRWVGLRLSMRQLLTRSLVCNENKQQQHGRCTRAPKNVGNG
jgi:hypothetical protein